jgi:hypothetical protein
MRRLERAVVIVIPLLLTACGDDAEAPAPAAAVPAQTQAAPQPVPAEMPGSVPLRMAPEGLLGDPATQATLPAPDAAPATGAARAAPPQPPTGGDGPPSEAEVRALYEGVMYTYAFDACGLPLIGQTARQDIEQRIEACPNPPLRKDAFRTVYHRAIELAQEDPEKMRASAGRACPDKREFLRRVMSHAGELQFDDSQPLDCGLLSPAPPGAEPTGPTAGAAVQKPF